MKVIIDARGGYKEWWPLGRKLLPIQFYRFEGGTLFFRTLSLALEVGDIYAVLVDEENKFLALEDMERLGISLPEELIKFEEREIEGDALVFKPFLVMYSKDASSALKKRLEEGCGAFFYNSRLPKPRVLHWNPEKDALDVPENFAKASELLRKGFLPFSGIHFGKVNEDVKALKKCHLDRIEVFSSLNDLSLLASPGRLEMRASENVSVFTERHTILSGIRDLVILDLEDLTFIASKDGVFELEDFYKKVKENGDEKHEVHKTAYRPWGSYTVLEEKPGFKVKRITVYPKKRLSLQLHYHRSEHWTVVKGTAKVTLGDKTILMRPGDHVYIPVGEVHRLENPGMFPLEVIEVQVGEYLGEDDIVRIEDDFKRI